MIIADWMSNIANLVFGHSEHLSILEAWGGSLAYTLQLYFDFSGYSEMAIGIALMLNYNLPINFNAAVLLIFGSVGISHCLHF